MSHALIPTMFCDALGYECRAQATDYYTLSPSFLRLPNRPDFSPSEEERAPGWYSDLDGDLCPEHNEFPYRKDV